MLHAIRRVRPVAIMSTVAMGVKHKKPRNR
jgi:hypothetical protein